MGATYRERLVELRRELLGLYRKLREHDGADRLSSAANDVADALMELAPAVLRLGVAPTDMAPIIAKHFGHEDLREGAPASSDAGAVAGPATKPAGTPAGPAVSPPAREHRKRAKGGQGTVSSNGYKGFRFTIRAAGKYAYSPTYPTQEQAEEARRCFFAGQPFPAAPRRAREVRMQATPATPAADAEEEPEPRRRGGRRATGCVHRNRNGWRFVIRAGGNRSLSPTYPDLAGAEAARAAFFAGLPYPPGKRQLRAQAVAKHLAVEAPPPANETAKQEEAPTGLDPNPAQEVRPLDHPQPEIVEELGGLVPPAASPISPRAPRRCKRCHQTGHRADTCDVDLTAARLQDIAAACQRLGLSPPPELRAPLPVVNLPPERQALIRHHWDRSDPDEDLTDLDLGAPEPEAPPPEGPTLVTPPRPVALEPLPDAAPTPPALERAREKLAHRWRPDRQASSGGRTLAGPRGVTIAGKLSRAEMDAGAELEAPEDVERPRTRGDCEGGPRPCPFVRCAHHLYLDVNPETGAIKLNFPHLEVWEMAETCSLDVADRGGVTLEEVGQIMNLTRERIRQVEVRALDRVKKRAGDDLEDAVERGMSPLAAAIDES